jgi:hypothetical protein
MLVHNGSLGGYDDLNKFAAHAKHGVEYMMKVMRRTYEGFLTPEELQAMIDGKDFWMDGKEFMERHGRRMEHFKAKLKMQKEAAVIDGCCHQTVIERCEGCPYATINS